MSHVTAPHLSAQERSLAYVDSCRAGSRSDRPLEELFLEQLRLKGGELSLAESESEVEQGIRRLGEQWQNGVAHRRLEL